MSDFLKIITTRRTVRRFTARPIDPSVLVQLIEAARSAPSAANKQPLQYVVVSDPTACARVFPLVSWAGHVRPRRDPGPGQEPKAYVVILVDRAIGGEHWTPADVGAAAENLMLAAWGFGIGSCWMGAIKRPEIARLLQIPENMSIDTLVALGYPAEEPVMEDVRDDKSPDATKYYLDARDMLHVPKRRLASIGHLNVFGTPLEK
jgi:nitroreductase